MILGITVAVVGGVVFAAAFGAPPASREGVALVDERRPRVAVAPEASRRPPVPTSSTVPLLDLPPPPQLPPSRPGYDASDRCPSQDQVEAATGVAADADAFRQQPVLLDAGPVRLRATSCTYPEVATVHLVSDPAGSGLAALWIAAPGPTSAREVAGRTFVVLRAAPSDVVAATTVDGVLLVLAAPHVERCPLSCAAEVVRLVVARSG